MTLSQTPEQFAKSLDVLFTSKLEAIKPFCNTPKELEDYRLSLEATKKSWMKDFLNPPADVEEVFEADILEEQEEKRDWVNCQD